MRTKFVRIACSAAVVMMNTGLIAQEAAIENEEPAIPVAAIDQEREEFPLANVLEDDQESPIADSMEGEESPVASTLETEEEAPVASILEEEEASPVAFTPEETEEAPSLADMVDEEIDETPLASKEAPCEQPRPERRIAPRMCCVQSEPLNQSCNYLPSYNAAAAIDVCHKERFRWPMNLFVDLSFTYWQAGQEGLALAYGFAIDGSNQTWLPPNIPILNQPQDFTPGFKFGVGMVAEHEWLFYTEYTWLRQRTRIDAPAPSEAAFGGNSPVWMVADWFQQFSTNNLTLGAQHLISTWHLGMDLLDFSASRPYYQSEMLTVAPFIGVRAAWIRQDLKMVANLFPNQVTGQVLGNVYSNNNSDSWGIGPRIGLDAKCLFPRGFRFEGDCAASILFTRYATISHYEDNVSSTENFASGWHPYQVNFTDYDCIRPAAETGLGVGWSRYFCGNEFHIDFAATYDFAIFWQQNMIRLLLDQSWGEDNSAAADLFYHGLTIRGQFDF